MKYWVSFIFVFWVVACSQPKKTLQEEVCFSDTIKYANGFSVRYFEDYTAVDIRDPWDSTRLLQRYLLVDRNKVIPKKLPTGTVVPIPVQNIVVYTAVHAAIIEQLGE
ncbi:MAG: ABC transporter substrate-binding protein, partial [Parabacteroides sp.]|nr:ABC transporter substrate-binding protein [Parabacteroides sp.]